MKYTVALLTALLSSLFIASAQTVVVSEYMCQSGGLQFVEKEWTELLVIADNISLVDHFVTDYDGTVTNQSGGPQFLDIPLWRNLRAGTIILLRHGTINEVANFDTSAADGYIELSQQDLRFFRMVGASLGMNIAQDLDYVEILKPDTTHLHGLAHCRSTSSGFANSANPKVAYDTNFIGDVASVRVTGRTLAAYDAGLGKDSVSRGRDLGTPSEAPSPGLPNNIDNLHRQRGFKNVNHLFWREVREPEWSATPSITIVDQQADRHVIQWTTLSDANTVDGSTGYVVLRDSLGFANFPTGVIRDGAIITAGQRIGTARVLAVVLTKNGNTYTDQLDLACGETYTYRVYGYRFDADQVMSIANTFDSTARGRQYNETFAQSVPVTKSNPTKPVIAASRTAICPGDTTTLTTTTQGADFYEWTVDGRAVPVGGTTKIIVREAGTYQLKIVAKGGCFAVSDPIAISFLPAQTIAVTPSGTQSICNGDSVVLTAQTVGNAYEWFRDANPIAGATSRTYTARTSGDYQVRVAAQTGCPGVSQAIRVRILDVRYHFTPATVDFGALGACESSTSQNVTLVNDGTESITIGNIAVPPGFAIASPPPGFVVPVGGSQAVRLLFAPSTNGLTNGTIVFTAQPCDVNVQLAVRGTRVVGLASLSRAGVDFGVYTACPGADIRPDSTFFIKNEGSDPITVKAPLVSPPFYLLTQFTSVVVQPDSMYAIRVQYRPLGADLNRGVTQEIKFPFTATQCSDTLRASLQAASYQPQMQTGVASINVGSVLACYGTADTVIDIVNPSPIEITLTSTVLGSIQLPDAPIVVPPASTRTVRIRVAPGGSGFFVVNDTLVAEPCGVKTPFTVRGTFIDPTYTTAPAALTLPDVHLCDANPTSSGTFTLHAIGSGGLRSTIISVDVSAPFTASLTAGQTLFDSLVVNVNYAPMGVANDADTIVVVIGPCMDTVKCIVQGTASSSARTSTFTSQDFGTIGPVQSASRVLTITNTGTENLHVDALEGVVAPFRIETSVPQLPTILAPGADVVVRIAYDFIDHDRKDTITITSRTTAPCPDTVLFTLVGATTPSDTAITELTIVIPSDLTARIGDVVLIPFAMLAPSSVLELDIHSVHVFFSYDPTILMPIGARTPLGGISATVTETRPGKANVEVTSQSPIDAADPLVYVDAKTFLGSARSTAIVIDSVLMNRVMDVEEEDGMLTLVGECAVETQMIALGMTPGITVAASSPTDVELELTTLTSDETIVALASIEGSQVVEHRLSLRPGVHRLRLNCATLASGAFLITMQHGRFLRSLPVFIVR